MSALSTEFLKEHGASIGAGAVVVLSVVVAGFLFFGGETQPVKKVPEVLMVKLQPLPPPPPPPPKIVEQPKMIEQTPVRIAEPKPDKPMDKPADKPKAADAPPPGPLALDAKGEGPADAFNLGGKEGGTGILGGGGGGSRWGWYASIVQTRIEAALRANPKTRNAAARNEIRLWLDASGRIERASLVSSTGDSEVDKAIEREVLPGLGFEQTPPKDMPMPVVVRLTARRPS